MTKTILITGAATRIGAHLANGLAADGWTVAIHYNNSAAPAQALADKIGGVIVQADLTDTKAVENLVGAAAKALNSPLTALINNASTYVPDRANDFAEADFDNHMDVNLKAPLLLSQHFEKQLPKGETGVIINMIDQRVLRPDPEFFTYALSKNALLAATKTLAQSFAPHIRVCGIGPGPTIQSVYQDDAKFAKETDDTLLGTGSPPDTILHAVRYFLSADAVTGQMIAVDGGQHLRF